MDWKKEAINDLRQYRDLKSSLESLQLKIAALEDKYQAIRCSRTDSVPVQGGASRTEDYMLSNIVERQKLGHIYRANMRMVTAIEKGLEGLPAEERVVLNAMYIDRERDYMDRLCEKLHCERSNVYKIQERAVRRFTERMYGIQK